MGIPLALLVAAAAAALAWRAGALDGGGAGAATLIGGVTLAAGGWTAGLVLLAFFLPSSAISRIWPGPSTPLDPKGNRRDARQVLANGGAPALALALGGPSSSLAFAAGLAAAAADTWGTAVGTHSPTPPRHILSGRVVPPGTSGGITPLGTVGACAGSALVATAALPLVGWRGVLAALLIGLGGMLLDSMLGAGVQGRFRCDDCGQESEWRRHRCGRPTRHLGGWAWLTNDGVNGVATAAAALAGAAAWAWCCAP